MSKFELFFPVYPYKVNQVWGIYNPAYQSFGFTRHNGIDLQLGIEKLRTPVRMKIYDQNYYPKGGGYQVSAITTEKWIVPHLDNRECYVVLTFMHNKEFLRKAGDVLEIGDEIAIPDSTGYSTGDHIHFGCYRVDENMTFIDKNEANGSFDPSLYWNKYYAKDSTKIFGALYQIIALLTGFLKGRK